MDEVSRTASVYEGDTAAFVEKYRSESVAALYGQRFFEALAGERVLDVGCGPGADSTVFAERGFEVTGFDRTRPFLETVREQVPEARAAHGDMRWLPFRDDAFDGVWSSASLLHVPREDVPATLQEFRRVLAPDGVVFASLKRGEESGYSEDGRYFERYTPAEVRRLFAENGFDCVDIEIEEVPDTEPPLAWISVLAGDVRPASED
ncbi:class I SAM-dependent methyltransferase [Haloarchaeobius sp. HME9146]|uniref:class I SAM-dependent methyltransferase n=1 Tax=Haloarchaeobius sp. HME9146 TaxID=2978732 RepID=UPI0021C00A6C|nr:methyltransferase domain-containing protein [Haloarchaeobius sp. HME9146]MCT9097066.1 methyltransferase domain-containing protein [Haloarchaeobius sp. HME9146]